MSRTSFYLLYTHNFQRLERSISRTVTFVPFTKNKLNMPSPPPPCNGVTSLYLSKRGSHPHPSGDSHTTSQSLKCSCEVLERMLIAEELGALEGRIASKLELCEMSFPRFPITVGVFVTVFALGREKGKGVRVQ